MDAVLEHPGSACRRWPRLIASGARPVPRDRAARSAPGEVPQGLARRADELGRELYRDEQALCRHVANYRAAAEQARKADAANKVRVEAEQAQINKEQSDEYEARVTAARALADRLRHELAAAANPGSTGKPPVSGIPAPAGQPPQTATDRLSDALTATEQAIQLDELIKWVRRQHDVDPNGTQPTQGAKP
jgi:hypothetical protein